MSGNRSLDEFAGAGAGEASGGEGAESDSLDDEFDPGSAGSGNAADDPDGGGDSVDTHEDSAAGYQDSEDDTGTSVGGPADDADDSGSVEADVEAPGPPASTYVWSPGGGTCAGCGETAEERWRDGEDLVCAGCKEW